MKKVESSRTSSHWRERMMSIVERDGRDLLLANLLLQSRGLVDEAKERVLAALERAGR